MLALAGYSLSGRMMSLPSFLRAPDTSHGEVGSFFALGVFSGIASSCCAPVLAGVMTGTASANVASSRPDRSAVGLRAGRWSRTQ